MSGNGLSASHSGVSVATGVSERVRVVLADDHACVRRAMAEWIGRTSEFEVVAEASTAEEAVSAAREKRADIVVFDIDMPGTSAFLAAEELHRQRAGTRIVFLSGFCNDRYIADALAARASAYVTKSEPAARLLDALSKVAEGQTYFSPEVRDRLVVDDRGVRLGEPARTRSDSLTDREAEVLRHVARGLSKREIAKLLFISARTVERHVANMMAKLGIHDRVGLARFAIREGFIEP
ncbi:MAG: response regulator transcription factor [Phycisphaerae bacterium]|nr:response regulator transcription factor [Phycisphaerae bacterium]